MAVYELFLFHCNQCSAIHECLKTVPSAKILLRIEHLQKHKQTIHNDEIILSPSTTWTCITKNLFMFLSECLVQMNGQNKKCDELVNTICFTSSFIMLSRIFHSSLRFVRDLTTINTIIHMYVCTFSYKLTLQQSVTMLYLPETCQLDKSSKM